MTKLSKLKSALSKSADRFYGGSLPLERRMSNIFFLFGAVSALFSFLTGRLDAMPPLLCAPSLLTALLCLYFLTRPARGPLKGIVWLMAYISFLYAPHMLLARGGADLGVQLLLLAALFVDSIVFPARARLPVIAGAIALNSAAYLAAANSPWLVYFYAPRGSTVFGSAVSFVLSGCLAALMGRAVYTAYKRERATVGALLEELRRANAELTETSMHDALTGSYNRRYLFKILASEMTVHLANNMNLCLLMLDLDNFKAVNDTHGHSVGDEILKMTVAAARSSLRQHDVLARYGGEEFCVLLPGCAKPDAVNIAERLRRDIAAMRYRRSVRVTASVGLAELRPGDTPQALLDRADSRLYAAKRKGRDRVEYE